LPYWKRLFIEVVFILFKNAMYTQNPDSRSGADYRGDDKRVLGTG